MVKNLYKSVYNLLVLAAYSLLARKKLGMAITNNFLVLIAISWVLILSFCENSCRLAILLWCGYRLVPFQETTNFFIGINSSINDEDCYF